MKWHPDKVQLHGDGDSGVTYRGWRPPQKHKAGLLASSSCVAPSTQLAVRAATVGSSSIDPVAPSAHRRSSGSFGSMHVRPQRLADSCTVRSPIDQLRCARADGPNDIWRPIYFPGRWLHI